MRAFLHLYNTESLKKEKILPEEGKAIRIYTCGPTVYNFAHIGNFRTYIFEDLLKRTLLYFGYEVLHVMNLTDVDDKTIKGAIENKCSLLAFTDPYKKAFFEDIKTLNIQPADFYPEATHYIPEMIEIIEGLKQKGFAYVGSDGSVYFSIKKFPSYGRLSHLHLEDLKEGASERIMMDEYDKESAADFVLWKSYDPKRDDAIFWESPFGKGRPGWHIECSAMSMKLLGTTVDIHCGGVDNIFPHHENEIAQSEAYSGKRFVRYWAHSEHLLVDHHKMSKSLGNFYTLRDLLKMGYSGTEIRYLLMQTHYRVQLNFTHPSLEGARASLQRMEDFIRRLREISDLNSYDKIDLKKASKGFTEALEDDLNISLALSYLFDLIREGNTLADEGKLGKKEAEKILSLLNEWNGVLGVLPFEKKEEELPRDVLLALQKREEARLKKNFTLADELRQLIHSLGYLVDDTPKGPRAKKI